MPLLHTNEATKFSQCSTGDGAQHRDMVIELMEDMGDVTGVRMEKEGLGQTTFMF